MKEGLLNEEETAALERLRDLYHNDKTYREVYKISRSSGGMQERDETLVIEALLRILKPDMPKPVEWFFWEHEDGHMQEWSRECPSNPDGVTLGNGRIVKGVFVALEEVK